MSSPAKSEITKFMRVRRQCQGFSHSLSQKLPLALQKVWETGRTGSPERDGRGSSSGSNGALPLNLLARHGDDKLARAAPEFRNRWKSR